MLYPAIDLINIDCLPCVRRYVCICMNVYRENIHVKVESYFALYHLLSYYLIQLFSSRLGFGSPASL